MREGAVSRSSGGLASAVMVATLAVLAVLAACRPGVPVVDTAPRPDEANGTISGTVRGPEGTSPIEGRRVEVIDTTTGERQATTTNEAGGFTFKVKPGRYRVQLALRDGETIVKQPGIMNVNRSDVDASADFVLGVVRISRPRHPAYQTDPALGAPIA